MESCAIYISSFDGYSDLWNPFFEIFYKYWPDCKFSVYLVNNQMAYKRKGVRVIHTGSEKSWFDRTQRSLEIINEKYVLFLLEDYFISKKINNQDIEEILCQMEEENIYFYRLSPNRLKKDRKAKCQKVPSNVYYPITLQPAIWERKKLLTILSQINGQTPWDFEYYFNNLYKSDRRYLKGVLFDNRDLLGYRNGVLRGKWIPGTVNYYSKQGIKLDTSVRETLPLKIYIRFLIADKVGGLLPRKLRETIKVILNMMHINYK